MTEESSPVPSRLADFEVIRRLGVGGMAEVFLAKKRGAEGTYKLLVVKRILPQFGSSRRFRTMFAEEAMLATRLNHPNIVQVYEFQDYGDDGQLLSMEYVEGPDLRKVMRGAKSKRTRIPPWVSAYIISEVAKGLHYAHDRKDERGNPMAIVHRDVSPQNILLSLEGAVKVADFGIASANLFREEPGVLKGKTAYMSPEQARAEKVDRRTDIYSLGVVFHELLTGRPLHGAIEGNELLEAVRAGQVEPPSMFAREVPAEIEAIIMKALARSPDERYLTARDFAAAITRALFQAQQPIDSHVLESVLEHVVGREHTSPGIASPPDVLPAEDGPGGAAGAQEGREKNANALPAPGEVPAEPVAPGQRRSRHGVEVRHVAVLSMQLHGVEQLAEAAGSADAGRFIEQLRATLGEIAFKRGARLTWHRNRVLAGEHLVPSGGATAIVGLLANPARAASDAAWLAIDIHEAIAGTCDDMPVELQASIGIVRGIATGQRDRAGHLVSHSLQEPALELARMLSQQAPAGDTWVAGGTYRLVRRDFVWTDAPTLELDRSLGESLPNNMRIYSLVRPLTRTEKAQEQERGSGDLIGRDVELAELQGAFHQAINRGSGDQGHMIARVVTGEMGIGKSALVSAFVGELPEGTLVVRAESTPSRIEVPFTLLADWIRGLTGLSADQSPDSVQRHLERLMGGFSIGDDRDPILSRLAALVTGQLAQAVDEGDAAQNRRFLTAGLRAFIARQALECPVVLIGENLQWADRASVECIQELLRWNETWPVLAVFVLRSGDRMASVAENAVRIDLRELSREHQVRLLATRLGADLGVEQICDDLAPRIGGNPFFLLEMVDALLERGTLELRETSDHRIELIRVDGKDATGRALPQTLEQLIADRLDELPTEEQAVVDWLAISGGPLPFEELKALLGPQAEDGVSRLCARGLCDLRAEEIDVRHPVTRDVAYSSLDPKTRVSMHRKLGEQLLGTALARGLTAAIVAQHLEAGGAQQRAADLYLEAARTAHSSYQLRLAKRYFKRVVRILPSEDARLFEAHESLEGLCRVQGQWQERRVHLGVMRRLARNASRPRWAAVALMRTARFDVDSGRLARGLTSAQRAETIARAAALCIDEVSAQALIGEILRDLGDMQGALAAVDRALETAGLKTVPPRQRAEVLRAKGTLLRRVGRVHEAVAVHAEAIAIFRRAGAKRMEAQAKNSLAFTLYVLGRFEDSVALGLEAIRLDLAIGGRLQIAKTLANVGLAYCAMGDLERGLAYQRRARRAHVGYGDQESKADTLLGLAESLLECGELVEAESIVAEASTINNVTGSAYDTAHEKILRALIAREMGDPATSVMYAFDARQVAEAQAYVAFHFYAMAIEASSRVEIGEQHTGILLATTALGAMETIQGSEYGLATRVLCCEAMQKAGSPQTDEMVRRAALWLKGLGESIHSDQLRAQFLARVPAHRLIHWHDAIQSSETPAAKPLLRPLEATIARLRELPGSAPTLELLGGEETSDEFSQFGLTQPGFDESELSSQPSISLEGLDEPPPSRQ